MERAIASRSPEYRPALVSERSVVEDWLAGRSAATLAAYRADLEDFRSWLGAADLDAAARELLSRGHGEANRLALSYRAHLVERKLSSSTVNRRLTSLRSMVSFAQTIGAVSFSLNVKNVRSEAYRDTRGPGAAGVQKMRAKLSERTDAKGARDRALVSLLSVHGLRRGEAISLDVEHLDLEDSSVWILGKGRAARERIELTAGTVKALREWLEFRGTEAGPLFVGLSNRNRRKPLERITGTSVYCVVRGLGSSVGLKTRPHGLRHQAITAGLDLSGGDVRAVQQFSRHRSLAVLVRYDDNRIGLGAKIAKLLDAAAAVQAEEA